MDNGHYLHFGLKNVLKHHISKINRDINGMDPLRLCFGIDGIPIANSSRSSFWPILVKIKGFRDIYPVGVFCGNGKPDNLTRFMAQFCEELEDLLHNGLNISEDTVINCQIGYFGFDAAARSFILDIVGHNAYYGCPKCTTRGTYINRRMTYNSFSDPLRTDNTFRNMTQPGHHKNINNPSPLAQIGVNCVSDVPIDVLHCIYLGVFRTILRLWTQDGLRKAYSLSDRQKEAFSQRVAILKVQTPDEFQRKPRDFSELAHFKGTELRLLLLYTGPLLFRNILKPEHYNNYLDLCMAIRLLSHKENYRTRNTQAKQLLIKFVRDFRLLYGEGLVVYNIHLLIHIADDCLRHGSLESFSTFCFENYLQFMISVIKKAPKPLEQLRNRVGEHFRYANLKQINDKVGQNGNGFTYLYINDVKYSTNPKDRYFLVDQRVYEIQKIKKINDTFVFEALEILNTAPLFLNSNTVGILKSVGLYKAQNVVEIAAEKTTKLFMQNIENIYVFVSFLH
jgi:hypothetical protein